jgi:hypothetical protein
LLGLHKVVYAGRPAGRPAGFWSRPAFQKKPGWRGLLKLLAQRGPLGTLTAITPDIFLPVGSAESVATTSLKWVRLLGLGVFKGWEQPFKLYPTKCSNVFHLGMAVGWYMRHLMWMS